MLPGILSGDIGYVSTYISLYMQRYMLVILGMLLKFSTLCVSKDVGSLESLYRRRSTKPMVEEAADSLDHASAPDHLNMIPEHSAGEGFPEPESRISLSGCRQVSCPEFEIRLQEKTRNIRKIHSMGS